MMPSRHSRERGFTLLELLVALVVFGFILAGLSQGVRFGLNAWDRQARIVDARGNLDAVDRTLRTLVARLDPASVLGGRPHAMAFTSELPEMVAVTTRQADVLLLVDSRHRLVLRWLSHLHAERFGPLPAPHEEVLANGVDRLDLAYWGRDEASGWVQIWNDNDPPALIRIRLIFPAGDPRHWPDIVVATIRDRPGGR